MNALDTKISHHAAPGAFAQEVAGIFDELGLSLDASRGTDLDVRSPIDGSALALLRTDRAGDMDAMVANARTAFAAWKDVPGPHRGELVRRYGLLVREHKEALSRLLTIENGKILTEARGEVQEVIDICEYAVGLSRQLFGLTIASERAEHRLTEYWHPLGVLGLISAFNFPAAVWAWGTTVALVCGDSAIWKPSEKTPLTALAFAGLLQQVAAEYDLAPDHLVQVAIGDAACGAMLADHPDVAILSATGSVRMGQDVGVRVQRRFGRPILELGGNNAAIVCPTADLDLTLRGVAFAAMGTAGQRCTSLRRLFVHESVYDKLVPRLIQAYGSVTVGNPLQSSTLVGPLIDEGSFSRMQKALDEAKAAGGKVSGGDRLMQNEAADAYYVRPAIVEMPAQTGPVKDETFAPILYIIKYNDFDEA
ncbi:MAG TPA: aldehyde dehydrogenase family protein, partial [Sphingopyxis sp.]|nr:aldehyde dehydrogenase family protein [Sphingopyxis sp.]